MVLAMAGNKHVRLALDLSTFRMASPLVLTVLPKVASRAEDDASRHLAAPRSGGPKPFQSSIEVYLLHV